MSLVTHVNPGCCEMESATGDFYTRFLRGASVNCSSCGARINEWREVLTCLAGPIASFMPLLPFGGSTALVNRQLRVNEVNIVPLVELGVPENSRVHDVKFTQLMDGPASTDDFVDLFSRYGTDVRLERSGHELVVLPHRKSGSGTYEVRFSMLVHFIEWPEELYRQLLIDAAFAFVNRDYRRAVIDAHTATDVLLGEAITAWFAPSKKVENGKNLRWGFLDKFDFLIRLLHEELEMGRVAALKGSVRKLNKLRNNVAHPPGDVPLDQVTCAELLTAALFCIEMLERMGPEVIPTSS